MATWRSTVQDWHTSHGLQEGDLLLGIQGKLDDRDFVVYINALTGEEEDILMIVNTQRDPYYVDPVRSPSSVPDPDHAA